jgi:hypothetical protein
MASNPKKTIDPTEAALSAIQEALNIHDDEEPAPQAASAPHPVEHQAPVAPPAFHEHFEPAEAAGPNLDAQAPGAANDDRQSIGQILQALQRRPARTSYFVAAIFSAAWIVCCLALSWAYLSARTIRPPELRLASARRRCCRSSSFSASPTWPGAARNCG